MPKKGRFSDSSNHRSISRNGFVTVDDRGMLSRGVVIDMLLPVEEPLLVGLFTLCILSVSLL
jgi:hypothetical protein